MPSPSFTKRQTDLGGGLNLLPFSADTALALAEACAVIDPWARAGITADHLLTALTQQSDAIHARAIDCNGELAGGLIIHHPWLKGPYLQFIAILPAFQNKGYGRSVMEWMEAEARPASRNLWLLASDFNEAALRFYESLGFERIAPLPGLMIEDCTEILMRKRLL